MALHLGRDAVVDPETAIGVQAIESHRMRVRFFQIIELVDALEQENAIGKPGQIRTGWCIPIW